MNEVSPYKKIALLFDYSGTKDLRCPENGNPGIGGTQYNYLTLAYYFNKHYQGLVEWTFLASSDNVKLPQDIQVHFTPTELDISDYLKAQNPDLFIWRPRNEEGIVKILNQTETRGIAWMNNVPSPAILNQLASSNFVKRVVFAGHEALDMLRDHPVIQKSTVIFNGFDPRLYSDFSKVEKDKNLVVYLGSLTYAKSFHLLARIWPRILKEVPNARLKVIGSGKLYNESEILGPFGLAEEKYESSFTRPLLDEHGNIIDSVEFLGVLGREMIPILQSATVGVINPHGRSEVCPGSAIEFMASGTPVVAGARFGNLDVIEHNISGYTEKKLSKLADRIIYLLKNPLEVKTKGEAGAELVKSKFDQHEVVNSWKKLFDEVMDGREQIDIYPMKRNYLYNFKFILEILGQIKFRMGIARKFPSVYEITQKHKF